MPPPGEARDDWKIARDFASCLGENLGNADTPRLFAYTQAEDVFNEHRETTRGRDLDITGLLALDPELLSGAAPIGGLPRLQGAGEIGHGDVRHGFGCAAGNLRNGRVKADATIFWRDHRMGAGMPPGRGAAPIMGEKPTPALQKAP